MAAPKLNGAEPRQQLEQPRSERFRVSPERLRAILSLLLKLAAILPLFFAFLIVFTMEDDDSPGLFLLILCLGGILALLLFTAGELVKIFSETSANTRRILERIDPTHQN